jgi:hypothetical protein
MRILIHIDVNTCYSHSVIASIIQIYKLKYPKTLLTYINSLQVFCMVMESRPYIHTVYTNKTNNKITKIYFRHHPCY